MWLWASDNCGGAVECEACKEVSAGCLMHRIQYAAEVPYHYLNNFCIYISEEQDRDLYPAMCYTLFAAILFLSDGAHYTLVVTSRKPKNFVRSFARYLCVVELNSYLYKLMFDTLHNG